MEIAEDSGVGVKHSSIPGAKSREIPSLNILCDKLGAINFYSNYWENWVLESLSEEISG